MLDELLTIKDDAEVGAVDFVWVKQDEVEKAMQELPPGTSILFHGKQNGEPCYWVWKRTIKHTTKGRVFAMGEGEELIEDCEYRRDELQELIALDHRGDYS